MKDLFRSLSSDARKKLKRKKQPAWTAPMLAKLTDDRFSKPDWIYERKFDGERCLAFRNRGQVRLLSRNRKPLNANYPETEIRGAISAGTAPRSSPARKDWRPCMKNWTRISSGTLLHYIEGTIVPLPLIGVDPTHQAQRR